MEFILQNFKIISSRPPKRRSILFLFFSLSFSLLSARPNPIPDFGTLELEPFLPDLDSILKPSRDLKSTADQDDHLRRPLYQAPSTSVRATLGNSTTSLALPVNPSPVGSVNPSSIPPGPASTSSIPPDSASTSSIPPGPASTSSIPAAPASTSSIPAAPANTSSIPVAPVNTSSIPVAPVNSNSTISPPSNNSHPRNHPPGSVHSDDDDDEGGLSSGAIAAIVIASIIGFLIILSVLAMSLRGIEHSIAEEKEAKRAKAIRQSQRTNPTPVLLDSSPPQISELTREV
ncbi:hypothetical protein DFH28DRAFT_711362 [Melampsora americana]|nr:hypothetical protein DFH28DRAFT_711362 [Melampsora americana]